MLSQPNISELYLGDVDGENEATKENFNKLFYQQNDNYKKIIKGDKFIIQGKKGTGKTILAEYVKYLSSSNSIEYDESDIPDFECDIFKMCDIQTNIMKEYNSCNIKENEYKVFFKWYYIIMICKLLISKKGFLDCIFKRNKYKIKQFLDSKYPSSIYRPKSIKEEEAFKDIINIGNKTLSAELMLKLITESVPNAYVNQTSYLESLMKNELKRKKVIIFIDDIDSVIGNIKDDKHYMRFIVSMINSTNDINKFFKNENLDCKIVLLIRDDIMETLHNYDTNINKYDTRILKLNWIDTVHKNHENPLINLVCSKIKNTNSYYSEMNISDIYLALFENCMPLKLGLTEFFIQYGFGRPREVIKILSIIIEQFPNEKTFSDGKIYRNSLEEYSNWFLNEIKNEMAIHKDAAYIQNTFDVLINFGKSSFTFEEISDYIKENKDKYKTIKSITEFIDTLYKFGIVGGYKKSTTSKSFYYWIYRTQRYKSINLKDRIIVHNGLRRALGLLDSHSKKSNA